MYNSAFFVNDAHYRHGCENNDTERANVKPQYCERNVSWSRHMAVWSACKIYSQGENVGARADGFEKNTSQNTRRPSPQPVNFCLEWLFSIELLDIRGKKSTKILWELSEVKVCWWFEKPWSITNFSATTKTKWLWTWHCPRGKFVAIRNDAQIT